MTACFKPRFATGVGRFDASSVVKTNLGNCFLTKKEQGVYNCNKFQDFSHSLSIDFENDFNEYDFENKIRKGHLHFTLKYHQNIISANKIKTLKENFFHLKVAE